MDFINDLIVSSVASPWLYLVMFTFAVIDGFFPPIPSETILVAGAAVAVSSGGANIVLLGVAAAMGAVVGDNIAYAIGRAVGVDRFRWMRRPRVAASMGWAQEALQRNGAGLILGGRFIPVGRVAVNMSAGALGYPWQRFFPLSVVAGVTWSAFSIAIGLLAGNWVTDQPLLSAILGIVVALAIGVVIDRLMAVRRRRASNPVLHPEKTDSLRGSEHERVAR